MAKKLLIIFTKNPEKGKVKTRLASFVGEDVALLVYQNLLLNTLQNVTDLAFDKCVAYSDYINRHDIWDNKRFMKCIQSGDDLGERMHNAFTLAFNKKYEQICLIGSDIPKLTSTIIEQAFQHLYDHDLVIGPAVDGGYYLIGMKHPHPELFEGIPWSTNQVFHKTLNIAKKQQLRFATLPTLYDIDKFEDITNEDKGFLLS
jgi:rSAM/selenodomain-associated transferase 1